MTPRIHGIETASPPYAYHQEYAMACMKRWVKDKVLQRMVHSIYRQSGIEQRFSVLPDFQPGETPAAFIEQPDGTLLEPSTGQRNRIYETTYPALACDAVSGVFARTPWLLPAQVTHVITVSCTGFTNPGPDLLLVQRFGLSPSVERYHLGFMGCYAAFPALRMADQFCRANPRAVVLVLCLELCSLHLQVKPTPDSLLANALFADGAAAVLVSALSAPDDQRTLALESFATRLIPEGAKDMAWTIGDRGFDMILSSYVPRILGLHCEEVLRDVVAQTSSEWETIQKWAVHPGGKAILAALESNLGWTSEGMLAHSYRVLRNYGNMSSATILFVLKAFMDDADWSPGATLGSLAFGPGLTVEFGLMRMLGQKVATAPAPGVLRREVAG